MKLLITLLVTLGISMGSYGAEYVMSGNELLADCESEGIFESGLCYGYINGFMDLQYATVRSNERAMPICIPSGVNKSQLKTLIVKDMKEHPEKLHYPAAVLVGFSLVEAYPCED